MSLKGTLVLANPDDSVCIEKIVDRLSKRLGEPVDLEVSYDPGIIGGFIAEIGGRYYDASIPERLFRMKQFILG